jgi:hypothetical protein
MITIRNILPQALDAVWPDIETWVKNALADDKSYTSDDVKEACRKKLDLWLIYNGKLKGFLISSIYDAPQCKCCYAPWLGGEDLSEWVAEAFKIFGEYLKENGVEQYSFIGRKAWGRLINANSEQSAYSIIL